MTSRGSGLWPTRSPELSAPGAQGVRVRFSFCLFKGTQASYLSFGVEGLGSIRVQGFGFLGSVKGLG